MIIAQETENEKERLLELKRYGIMDTEQERDFDNLTKLASEICGTKISLVSLLDNKRQWFKSKFGLVTEETPKEYAFCAHAIREPSEIMIVKDSREDERFHDNPLVNDDPHVVFYAGVPLVSPDGHPLGTLCVIDDTPKELTEQQQEQLRILSEQVMTLLELRKRNSSLENLYDMFNKKNNELDSFFSMALDLLCVANMEGKFIRVNKAWEEVLGYKREELEGKLFLDFIHPDDLQDSTETISTIENRNSILGFKNRYRTKKGDYKYMEWRAKAKDGIVFAAARDITDNMVVMEELTLTKELLETTSKVSQVGGWTVDFVKNTVNWSDITKEIHEVPMDFVPDLEKGINFYKEGESRDKIAEKVSHSMETGEDWDVELQLITAKGNEIWVRARGKVEMKEGKCTKLYGTFEEITQKKEAQQILEDALAIAREAAIAKSSFLSNMSHEIRTPLNAVIGMAHLLLENDPREDQMERLSTLHFSANNLLSLVNDILDYNKIEEGKVTFENISFDLRNTVAKLRHAFEYKAKEKGIHFRVNIDTSIPDAIKGDPTRLVQILNNLIGNAVKFTDKGKVTLTIEKEYENNETIGLYFEIRDTGIGMSTEQFEQVFERFTQASAGTTRKFGGTGLGLSIVKRLLELQGSKIDIDSREGKGSTFSFLLELERSEEKGKAIPSTLKGAGKGINDLMGMRILLVEDNEVNQLVATEFLKSWNVVLDYALNGLEAVEKVVENDYDVILMDIQMPVMDGYQATMRIKAMESKKAKIPILAMTASAMLETRDRIIEIGMEDHILKPFNPQELNGKLFRYLPNKETGEKEEANSVYVLSSEMNLDALEKLSNGDYGFRKKLLETFIADLEKLGSEYTLAIDNKDKARIGFVTHRNKSMLTMLSLKRLENILLEDKKAVEEEKWHDIDIKEFTLVLERIKSRIENVLKENQLNI